MMLFWKHKKAPQGTIGDYRASLVRSLVSGMLDDRFNELSEKSTAPFLYAGGGYGGFLGRSCDAFIGSCAPKENRIEDATEAVLAEIFRAVQHGFTQTELDRQKEDILSWYTRAAKEADKTQSNDLADEITRHFLEGEVIPGIRQGKATVDYITRINHRITLFGAIFLAVLALVPNIVYKISGVYLAFAGSSLLIAVSVAVETARTLESQLLMRHYKGFLK